MRLTTFLARGPRSLGVEACWRRGELRFTVGSYEPGYPRVVAEFLDDDTGVTFQLENPERIAEAITENWGRAVPGPTAVGGPALLLAQELPGRRLRAELIVLGDSDASVAVFCEPTAERRDDRRSE